VETSIGKPYEDYVGTDYFLRVFYPNIEESELIWHRDKKDREIEVVSGVGWQLQMDDELPFELEEGQIYNIKKEEYHRLIKGKGTLRIKIRETENEI
jgi:hypothetical protein